MAFTQQPPVLDNQYLDDRLLRSLLRRVMPHNLLEAIEPGLTDFGELVAGDWWTAQVRDHASTPTLTHYDAWGNRIDRGSRPSTA
jgi:hypothetical protein